MESLQMLLAPSVSLLGMRDTHSLKFRPRRRRDRVRGAGSASLSIICSKASGALSPLLVGRALVITCAGYDTMRAPVMETKPEHISIRQGVVLWKREAISCTCLHLATGPIEVTIAVDGVVVSTEVFAEFHDASEYAISKMHAYNAA